MSESNSVNRVAAQPTHFYYRTWVCWDGCPPDEDGYSALAGHDCYETVACPITRITAKRIYFRDGNRAQWRREREWFVDRAAIEGKGDICGQLLAGGGVFHSRLRQILHLQPPEHDQAAKAHELIFALGGVPREKKSVAELRREMAECHPDRGGDPDAFRTAHARYVAAKAVAE